jgi:hypothetical protein
MPKRLKRSILVVGFLFGLAETFIFSSEPLLLTLYYRPGSEALYSMIALEFTITSLLIDPFIIFLVMFLIGRGLDPSFDFVSSFVSLFAGALLGTIICLSAITGYLFSVSLLANFEQLLIGDLLVDSLGALRVALVGFGGLALGHFLRGGALGQHPA